MGRRNMSDVVEKKYQDRLEQQRRERSRRQKMLAEYAAAPRYGDVLEKPKKKYHRFLRRT